MAQALINQKIKKDYVKVTFNNVSGSQVLVYPGTKYKLGSMANESTSLNMQMITTTSPINGYIKIKDATIS